MPSNLLSILGTIGGVAGQAIANQQNAQQNALNRQHELYMLGQQQQWAAQQAAISDMRQRALYNDLQSPEAIRKQLEKAGLSVGLMYGQGGMGGQMTSGAQADSPGAQNRGTIPMQNVFDAQIAAILADAKLKEAQTEKTQSETEVNKSELPLKEQALENMKQIVKESEQRIEQSKAEINKIGEQIINIRADTDLKNNESKLAEAQVEVQKAVKEWQDAQTNLAKIDLLTRGEFNRAQIDEIKANIKQLNAAAYKLKQEGDKAGVETQILEDTKWAVYQKAMAEATMKKMEQATWIVDKKMEWKEVEAEIEQITQDAKNGKIKNSGYKRMEKIWGEDYARLHQSIQEMLSVFNPLE